MPLTTTIVITGTTTAATYAAPVTSTVSTYDIAASEITTTTVTTSTITSNATTSITNRYQMEGGRAHLEIRWLAHSLLELSVQLSL
jgi:hypothetical protein